MPDAFRTPWFWFLRPKNATLRLLRKRYFASCGRKTLLCASRILSRKLRERRIRYDFQYFCVRGGHTVKSRFPRIGVFFSLRGAFCIVKIMLFAFSSVRSTFHFSCFSDRFVGRLRSPFSKISPVCKENHQFTKARDVPSEHFPTSFFDRFRSPFSKLSPVYKENQQITKSQKS